MCVALPGRIVDIDRDTDLAQVDVGGILREVNLATVGEPCDAGDYVLIHSGFALQRLNPDQAREAMALFEELSAWTPEQPGPV